MSTRRIASLLGVLCALALVGPAAAGAQTSPTGIAVNSFRSIPLSGTTTNGTQFKGHFKVDQFVARDGHEYAVGTMIGQLGHRHVVRRDLALPVSVQRPNGATTAASCPILHLVLGPLSLNLLGLQVNLNQVVLDITAQSGPGNLLGNLLCSVSNLLNNSGLPVSTLSGLLNILQQVLNAPGLLNL